MNARPVVAVIALFASSLAACSSSDPAPDAPSIPDAGASADANGPTFDGGAPGVDSGGPGPDAGDPGRDASTGGDASGGDAGLHASPITTDKPVQAAYVAALASGDIVVTDDTTHAAFQVSRAGAVSITDTADFGATNDTSPGRVGLAGDGSILVQKGGKGIVRFGATLTGTPVAFLSASAFLNNVWAWGGPSGGRLFTWTSTGGANNKLESYDAATATAAGSPTTVASGLNGTFNSMTVDDAGNAFLYDFNGCHLVRVAPGGASKVLVGSTSGNECSFGALQQDRLGQGSGLARDAQGRFVFGDKMNHRVVRITIAADDSSRIESLYEDAAIAPSDVAVAPDGVIFFVESTTKTVWTIE